MTTEVIALAGWPPEDLAYGYAMYSRSALSIKESLTRIARERAAGGEKASKFFEAYYFGYGHASIADNAHIPLALEGISQIAAFALEDEMLWDGQERSTRYQDFSRGKAEIFTPRSISGTSSSLIFEEAVGLLLGEYEFFSQACFEYLVRQNPKPTEMKDEQYERTMRARAFDVARYWLFGAIQTNVGQITSARTLEAQITRLMSSEYSELVELAGEMKLACSDKPFAPEGRDEPPVAPTLVKHTAPNPYQIELRARMRVITKGTRGAWGSNSGRYVELAPCPHTITQEIIASLLYEASQISYRQALRAAEDLPRDERERILALVCQLRGNHDPLPRALSAGYQLAFDIAMDRGGARDMHRHRRCIQLHQPLTTRRGFDTPQLVKYVGLDTRYSRKMIKADVLLKCLREEVGDDADYLIPFAYRAGMLMKMDAREVFYITELRSGVGGHFSYRDVACRMYDQLLAVEPELMVHKKILRPDGKPRVTPFEVENLLKR